jgi:hypothetical protein
MAIAEHNTDLGHQILLKNTSILARKFRHMQQLIRKALEMMQHPYNINWEDGFFLIL